MYFGGVHAVAPVPVALAAGDPRRRRRSRRRRLIRPLTASPRMRSGMTDAAVSTVPVIGGAAHKVADGAAEAVD